MGAGRANWLVKGVGLSDEGKRASDEGKLRKTMLKQGFEEGVFFI